MKAIADATPTKYKPKPSIPPVINVMPTTLFATRIHLESLRKPTINGSEPIVAPGPSASSIS
jgi:hypothetical protein